MWEWKSGAAKAERGRGGENNLPPGAEEVQELTVI